MKESHISEKVCVKVTCSTRMLRTTKQRYLQRP